MVVIRLARGGAKKRPFYRIVVTDSRFKRDGRFVEKIGHYDPLSSVLERSLVLDTDRFYYWKGNGAQPSPTVMRLYRKYQKACCGTSGS